VLGLETGVDNYLVKPFAFGELLARVRSLLLRCQTEAPSTLRYGDLELETAGRQVQRGDRAIGLTTTEDELLAPLLLHPGQMLSRCTRPQSHAGAAPARQR
jgi:DNA-binding response OmpR family regulator